MKQLPMATEHPPKQFHYPDDKVLLVAAPLEGIFETVQGEGIYLGTPSLFIRTYGCNLTCEKCDTKASWHPDYVKAGYVEMSVEDLATIINESHCKHVVVTGGEPTLQDFALTAALASAHTKVVTLETNGLRRAPNLAQVVDLVSLSPKLGFMQRLASKSTPADLFDHASPDAWLPLATQDWLHQRLGQPEMAQMKLVVSDEREVKIAIRIFNTLIKEGSLDENAAFLQPEWSTTKTFGVREILRIVLEETRYAIRIVPQLHKSWGVP